MFFRSLAILVGSVGITGVALGDVIHLKDGTRVEGDVKHAEDGWNVKVDGKTVHIAADQIDSIELTGTASGPAQAASRLTSLRRSVENLGDLTEIVSRFRRFVDTNTDATAVADSNKDLAEWQDRANQKMVKVGGNWVLPAERQKLIDEAAASADQARQLLKQGRVKEADALVTKALRVDPQNAAALYLTGMVQYQQEQLPAARKSFEAVAGLVPNQAPSQNNLAVVLWRQRQFIPALSSYDVAMLASPVNKQILDNVASALLATPAEFKKSPVYSKVLRHFQEQDQQLSEQMGQTGVHRYGAVWVSDADMEQLRAQEKQTQDKLDVLAGEFDRSKGRVDQIEQNISDTQSQLHRIEATSVIGDASTGIPVQVPYPQVYYDLGQDLRRMQNERAVEITKLDGMKRRADDLQRNRPSGKFAGTQRIFGPEGTPLRTSPATRPSR